MTVYTGKIEVNDTRYETKGNLVADGKDVVATDTNLKNYNGSNVEVFFWRKGDVAKIVVTDAIVNSSSKFVVLTTDAQLAVNGSKQTLEFKAGDGTGVESYTIDLSKLETVIGNTGAYAIKGKPAKVGANTSAKNASGVVIRSTTYDAAKLDGHIVAKDSDGEMTLAYDLIVPSTDLTKGTLVSLTTKEDGTITGLALAEGPDSTDAIQHADVALNEYTNIFDGTTGKIFKSGYNAIGDGTGTGGEDGVLLPSTTPVLVYYPDSKDVKLYEYADVDFTFTVDNANDGVVRYDGAKAAAIAINAKNAGIAAAEVNKKHAVIVDATFDQSSTKKLVDLTVAFEDDAKVKYTELANDILVTSLDGGTATVADWAPGTYVEIEETKASGALTKVTATAATATLADETGLDKSEFVINGTYKLITADDAGVPTTIVTLSSDGKTVKAISWSDYCDYDRTKIASIDVWTYAGTYVDVIRVNLGTTAAPVTGMTFTAGTGNIIADTATGRDGNYIASTAATTLQVTVTGLPTGVAVTGYQWYYKASATAVAEFVMDDGTAGNDAGENTKRLTLAKVTNGVGTAAGTVYYVVVTGSDGEYYTSPEVTLAAPVATSISGATATGGLTFAAAENAITGVLVKDQFGEAMTTADDDGLATTGTTLTNTGIAYTKAGWNTAGILTITTS